MIFQELEWYFIRRFLDEIGKDLLINSAQINNICYVNDSVFITMSEEGVQKVTNEAAASDNHN